VLNDRRLRYLLVGGLCALAHNAIMIGGAALRAHYVATSAVSFAIVVVLGFALHTRFTFSVRPELPAFLKYAAGMALNYPIWVALMFVLYGMARLPMVAASPLGTVLLLGWNFAMSRWAILRRLPLSKADPAATHDAP
jgi:putative flippase GtrA